MPLHAGDDRLYVRIHVFDFNFGNHVEHFRADIHRGECRIVNILVEVFGDGILLGSC